MKQKMIAKIVLDVLLSAAMLLLMSYALLDEQLHEWLGIAAFAAFAAHHLLNAAWHKNLTKGRYTPLRAVTLAVNLLLFVCMAALAFSGMVLSQYVFAGLPLYGFTALARVLHLLGAYWGFVLMAVHLGLHWGMLCAMIKAIRGKTRRSPSVPGQLVGAVLAAYGLYAFIKNGLASYLFLRTQFVFIDFSQPLWQFMAEYLAIAALFIWVTQALVWLAKYAKR